MNTLRNRFIFSHLLPSLLIVPLIGAILIYALETQILLANLSQRLTEGAHLIIEAVEENPEIWRDSEKARLFSMQVNYHVEGQVLLIKPNGELLAGSDFHEDPAQLTQNLQGLEKALSGESSAILTYGWLQQRGEVLVPVFDPEQGFIGIVGLTHTLEGAASQFGHFRTMVLIILAIEIIAGVVLGLLMALRLELPIKRVTDSVIEIATSERFEPIPEEGPDEIQQLSASVNFLAERIRSLEETRRRLLANLIHELGRPLGAILAAIHVLKGEPGYDPEIRAELLEGVEKEVQLMKPMLDDLAQLHGQILGTLEIDRKPIELSEWLPSILLPWRAAAIEKNLPWEAVIPRNLPTIEIDPDRIAQVVGNLLSNGIKYTPLGGKISVGAGADKDEVWIQVCDSGPGISDDEQELVFEPFYRSSKEYRFPQGLGLGLTIARDLVEAHGGQLILTSAPGEGTRFSIHLPLNNR
jgi:two-component system sensor histidine kinase BaeS